MLRSSSSRGTCARQAWAPRGVNKPKNSFRVGSDMTTGNGRAGNVRSLAYSGRDGTAPFPFRNGQIVAAALIKVSSQLRVSSLCYLVIPVLACDSLVIPVTGPRCARLRDAF